MQHQQHQPRIVTTRKHYNTIDSSKSTGLTPTPTCELHRKGNQVRADVHDHSYRLRRVSKPHDAAAPAFSMSRRQRPQDKQGRKRRQKQFEQRQQRNNVNDKGTRSAECSMTRPTRRSSFLQEATSVNLRESVKSGKVEMDNSSGRPSDIKTAVSNTECNDNVHGSTHLQDSPSPTTSSARASRQRTEAQPQTPTRTCQAPSPQRTRHHGSSTTTTTPSSHHHSLPSLQLYHHLTTTTYPAKRRNGQQR